MNHTQLLKYHFALSGGILHGKETGSAGSGTYQVAQETHIFCSALVFYHIRDHFKEAHLQEGFPQLI